MKRAESDRLETGPSTKYEGAFTSPRARRGKSTVRVGSSAAGWVAVSREGQDILRSIYDECRVICLQGFFDDQPLLNKLKGPSYTPDSS